MDKQKAITLAGSQSELARILGITRAAVHNWKTIPTGRLYQLMILKPEWFKWLFYFSSFLLSSCLLVKLTFIGGCCFFSGFFTQSPQKTKNMYNPNRLSGIRRTKAIANPIDSCVVLPDNRRTFDRFQSSVVALAKSQDHRVIYGVFCFWGLIGLQTKVRCK